MAHTLVSARPDMDALGVGTVAVVLFQPARVHLCATRCAAPRICARARKVIRLVSARGAVHARRRGTLVHICGTVVASIPRGTPAAVRGDTVRAGAGVSAWL